MKFVTDCTDQLVSLVKETPIFGNKVITVLSMDEMLKRLSNVKRPAVGVLYEGGRSVSADNGAGRQVGVSGEIVFSLLMVTEVNLLSGLKDVKPEAHEMLDQMRESIQGVRSPTGHYWKWLVEAPVATKEASAVWLQRWSVPCQLPPKTMKG